MHLVAVSQLAPEYPALQLLHVHDPVVPPMVPPLTQWKLQSVPSSVELAVATQGSAVSQLAPEYPAAQVHEQSPVLPVMVPPLIQWKLPSVPSSVELAVATLDHAHARAATLDTPELAV